MRAANSAIRVSGLAVPSMTAAVLMIAATEPSAALADADVASSEPTPTVIVTARKYRVFDPVADAETTVRVVVALHDDPFLLDDHMSVTTVDGVVCLDGFVYDDWDLSQVLRLARRLAGGRRIVNRLEFATGGPE